MDPYLEGELWSTVHGQLVAEIARQLAPLVRPKYLALMEKRFATFDAGLEDGVSLSTPAGGPSWIVPDVAVAKGLGSKLEGGGILSITAPMEVETVVPESIPLHSIEIRDQKNRQLVTVIEVLSPANKSGEGRTEYLNRRNRLLSSSAHLLEIDLLRRGHRLPMREPLPSVAYFAFLCRAGRRPRTEVWPIQLRDKLPELPVPLLPGDSDVVLDLQRALTTVYDQLGYDLAVDYSLPADVPLGAEDRKWAEGILRSSGKSKS
jgi:hypothetical protein